MRTVGAYLGGNPESVPLFHNPKLFKFAIIQGCCGYVTMASELHLKNAEVILSHLIMSMLGQKIKEPDLASVFSYQIHLNGIYFHLFNRSFCEGKNPKADN